MYQHLPIYRKQQHFLSRQDTAEPAFSPLSIPGCILWLRADMGISLDGSNKVQAWLDQSGLGNHVSQATETKRPTMSTVNGKPVVTFLKSAATWLDNILLSGFPTSPADQRKYTVFAMYRPTTFYGMTFFHLSKDTTTITDGCYIFTMSGNETLARHTYTLQAPPGATTFSNHVTAAMGVPRYTCNHYQASDNKLRGRENGVALHTSTSTVPGDTIPVTAARIGNAYGNTASGYEGDIGEICVYGRELDITTEIQLFETYQAGYWVL